MKNYLLLLFVLVIASCNKKQEYAELVTLPNVEMKFDSAITVNGTHTVGVFARANQKEVFGINLRFFYDSYYFNNKITVKNFKGGYGLSVLGQPIPKVGTASSYVMFGFKQAATYVNGVVQLNDTSNHVVLDTLIWKRLFDIEFNALQSDVSCAPIVWEKMNDPLLGGFVGGSAGLVITVLAEKGTKYQTAPSIPYAKNSNWKFNDIVIKGKYPYGKIQCGF